MKLDLHENIDAVAIIDADNQLLVQGMPKPVYSWASVTKILTSLVINNVFEADWDSTSSLSLSTEIEFEYFKNNKVTFADLLSHSSGAKPNYEEAIDPHMKRIYTNEAYEIAEAALSKALGEQYNNITICELFNDSLNLHLETSIQIDGSCAYGASGSFEDLISLLKEMREPKFISRQAHDYLTSTYIDPLDGIVPGYGYFVNNTWGIGYEIHGNKNHWMGTQLSKRSYGHFGQSGVYVVHDPIKNVSIALVSNTDFGPWSKDVWGRLNDDIVEKFC